MLSVYVAQDAEGSLRLALTWNLAEVGEGLPRAGAEALPGCAVHSGIAAPAAQVKAVSKKGDIARCVCGRACVLPHEHPRRTRHAWLRASTELQEMISIRAGMRILDETLEQC